MHRKPGIVLNSTECCKNKWPLDYAHVLSVVKHLEDFDIPPKRQPGDFQKKLEPQGLFPFHCAEKGWNRSCVWIIKEPEVLSSSQNLTGNYLKAHESSL